MSRSHKARHGTKARQWKDTVGKSRSQAQARSRLKKVTKRSPKKTRQSRKPQKPESFEDRYEWDGHKFQGPIIDWSKKDKEWP